ncbi:hypothetical protein P9H28_22355 [Paenibacillus barengoltzii]|uniref:MFS transporter n=1 Tax=Paenibacillus barengoltzii TaxID=343517 RepID=UPI002DBEC271|nr:MFS transporter [Paenibacillus barengoltzii]MEC2346817.1 hypothetical protein [Paenibacillus barengoltzii]
MAAFSCVRLRIYLFKFTDSGEFVKNSFVRDLLQGWREFQSRTWLVLLVSLFSIFHLFIWAPLNTLGPIILEHNEAGLQSWTYYLTSLGVGSILAGIVAFKIKMTKVLTLITVLFIPTILPLVALLLPHSVWLLAISGFVAGLAMGVSDILWNTSLQSKLPERSLSKVSSFDYFASMVFLPLGYAMVAPATKLMNEQSYLVLCIFVMVFATVAIIPLILKIERIDSNESTNLC